VQLLYNLIRKIKSENIKCSSHRPKQSFDSLKCVPLEQFNEKQVLQVLQTELFKYETKNVLRKNTSIKTTHKLTQQQLLK
jgi:hypothetical protein